MPPTLYTVSNSARHSYQHLPALLICTQLMLPFAGSFWSLPDLQTTCNSGCKSGAAPLFHCVQSSRWAVQPLQKKVDCHHCNAAITVLPYIHSRIITNRVLDFFLWNCPFNCAALLNCLNSSPCAHGGLWGTNAEQRRIDGVTCYFTSLHWGRENATL